MAAQDMANKKKERNARNSSGTNTDRQAEVARGGKDDSNKRNKLRRNMKNNGTKFKKGEDAGHKKSLKSGGSSAASNGKKQSSKSNRSEGGKKGNKAGKAAGGRKSSRKGIKNK